MFFGHMLIILAIDVVITAVVNTIIVIRCRKYHPTLVDLLPCICGLIPRHIFVEDIRIRALCAGCPEPTQTFILLLLSYTSVISAFCFGIVVTYQLKWLREES